MNVGVFVDIGNLYYCINKKFPGRKLNYEKYLQSCAEEGDKICIAKAYGTQLTDEAQGFITCLNKIGYTPVYKSIKTPSGGNRKVHWDSQICIDVIKSIDRLDAVFIGTSNPDFQPLVEWVKNSGRQCIVKAAGVSRDLKLSASKYIELEEPLLEEVDVVFEVKE